MALSICKKCLKGNNFKTMVLVLCRPSSDTCMKVQEGIFNGFHVKHRHDFVTELPLKKFKGEQLKKYTFKSYGCCALHVVLWCLILVWNFMNISWTVLKLESGYGFVTETATYKVQRDVTQKVSIQELWFLHSACHLMLVNIYMKFHEDILNGFKVIEWTWFITGLLITNFKGR